MRKKIFLAVETTCDETSVALLEGRKIIRNLVYSQIPLHSAYKGVVPEVASRAHSDKIGALTAKALKGVKKIDGVVFSRGPGLLGSLLVGRMASQTVSGYLGVPLVGVNHLEGHLLACEIEKGEIKDKFRFPLIALIVSGGHSELWLARGYGEYELLGSTRDDAAGEAFDKVAKLMDLGYPGGPEVERLAALPGGEKIVLPVPNVLNSLEFSFSGLKTAVAYFIRDAGKLGKARKIGLARSFQEAVVESLFIKTASALEKYGVKQLAVCGGVSANGFLRKYLKEKLGEKTQLLFPEKKYCMDNAAMIGACGFRRFEKGKFRNEIKVDSDLGIRSWGAN